MTSLRAEGADITVEALLTAYLKRLFHHVQQWQEQGFAPIRARWLAFGPAAGAAMRVRLPSGKVTGSFDGLDERGSLLLATDGGPRRIDMGEVFPLPPVNDGVS